MKKLIALLLTAVMLMSCLAGCGAKPSGVTISQLENEMLKQLDDEGSFTVTSEGKGYAFTYTGSALHADLVINGVADKNENIISVSATVSGALNISYFKSMTYNQFMNDMNNMREVPMNRLAIEFLIFYFSYGAVLFSGDDSADNQLASMSMMLDARSGAQVFGGWTYTVEAYEETGSSDAKVVITATFGE